MSLTSCLFRKGDMKAIAREHVPRAWSAPEKPQISQEGELAGREGRHQLLTTGLGPSRQHLVRAVLDLRLGSEFLRFVLRVADADKLAIVDALEGVAGRADLLVDLVAAPDGRVVVRRERALMRPRELRNVHAVLGLG
jgi:hypothetical protein